MKKEGRLLVVDDNRGVLTAVELLMRNYFEEVRTLNDPEQINAQLRTFRPDVMLLDMNFRSSINTGNEGLFWLCQMRKWSPDTRIVLFTAYADVSIAVEGMKRGAVDFVVKPFENAHLVEVLKNAYHKTDNSQQSKNSAKAASKESLTTSPSPQMFWGTTPQMLDLKAITEKVARTDANILITGENGTGKELLAREIHRLSLRSHEAMVAVDMGAVSETLFESELFGYVRGAFTDAKADHAGKMEKANRGTLFMDEIGNLSYALQAKLLRALQQRQIVRVGGTEPIAIDIRLVCATNRDLKKLASSGDFREDLLYRINTIHLHLPSLSERRADIPALARLFVARFAKTYNKGDITLQPDACMKLQEQPWHGNIRELEHTIEKAVILSDSKKLNASDFDLSSADDATIVSSFDANKAVSLEDMERMMIKSAIDRSGGNLTLAANQLGITRQTLYNKLKRYGL